MEPLNIGILIVVILLVVEIVVMLLWLKVDKMLLLMPVIGVVLAVIAFVLNAWQDKILSSLPEPAPIIVISVILLVGLIMGLFGVSIWFKGEKEAKRLVSTEKGIDSAVSGIESDVGGGGMELEHFDDEMGEIKTKVDDYESREKEV
ncbi:hypothetical protein C5S53_12325 [Methanophagales archaeon]|nr:hypothetical protein C5S53_12325 [Methanophagales archaeon]